MTSWMAGVMFGLVWGGLGAVIALWCWSLVLDWRLHRVTRRKLVGRVGFLAPNLPRPTTPRREP